MNQKHQTKNLQNLNLKKKTKVQSNQTISHSNEEEVDKGQVKTSPLFVIFVWISLFWSIYIAAHYFFSDDFWAWNIISFIPPISYILVQLLLILAFLPLFFFLKLKARFKKLVLLSFTLLLITSPLAGILSDISFEGLNFGDVSADYTIVQFNTEFWEPKDNINSLYNEISKANADIYHFQEFIPDKEQNGLDQDSLKETLKTLQSELTDYSIIHSAELVTATRFPIFAYYEHPENYYLRTDVWIDDTIVRLYNVHLPVHVDPDYQLRNIDVLLEDIKSRFELRQNTLEAIYADINSSERPFIISGDFNSSSSMRTLSYLNRITKDSAYTNTIIPKSTWGTKNLRAWRIDYILAGDRIEFASHKSAYLPEFSDHSMLTAEFSLKAIENDSSSD